jgi:hypothetical protein
MSPEMRTTLNDNDPTVTTWRQMLVEVGGLSETEFVAFVSRWRDFVARPEGIWFDHETAGWYAAPMLIPAELREAELVGGRLVPLKNEIHYILDRHFQRRTFDSSRIPVIRGEIDRAVSDWIAEHRPAT